MNDELEILQNVKELIDAQNMLIKSHEERIQKLEDMNTKMANVIMQLKDENQQLAMGYNDILSRVK